MSKLVDKLKQASEAGTAPIGFKSAAAPKQPTLALIAEITLPLDMKAAAPSLDAVMIKMTTISREIDDIKTLKSVLGNTPFGVSIKNPTEKTIGQLKEAGCDFLVFKAAEAAATSVLDDDIGKIVIADSTWRDINLRSLETLGIDGILAEDGTEKNTLTVQSLIDLRRFSMLAGKPLLVRLAFIPSEKELSALVRIQARGLVIPVKSDKELAEMSKLRSIVDNLPRAKPKKQSISPLVPSVSPRAEEEEDEEEE